MRHVIYLIGIALLLLQPACAEVKSGSRQPFSEWLEQVKKDARAQGVSQKTLDASLDNLRPNDRVIELDQKQPESTLTLRQYLDRIVTEKRLKQGHEEMAQNRALLAHIGRQYGVQPRFIVALWGIETNFGRNTGGFDTVESLATLAYDGRRSEYFRGELIKALLIVDQEHMAPGELQGSWAGALGQCQFMPSSFMRFAVDADHDGKRDIWNDRADVFASIANYLKTSGWNASENWGRPVKLPPHFNTALADIKREKTIDQWRRLGVREAGGRALPHSHIPASLIMVGDGDDAAPYLVYGNYKVILKWNRSRYFATAVGMLADGFGR